MKSGSLNLLEPSGHVQGLVYHSTYSLNGKEMSQHEKHSSHFGCNCCPTYHYDNELLTINKYTVISTVLVACYVHIHLILRYEMSYKQQQYIPVVCTP